MKYYSTNHIAPAVNLKEAVTRGLAPDNGLYMPEKIPVMPPLFFDHIHQMTLQEIAFDIARQYFSEDLSLTDLRSLIDDALNFPIPLVGVHDNIYSLELFHGPTLAFKDIGARFMARLLGYFTRGSSRVINVLVATSGDTGSAVAHGFYKVQGINVFILYPKGLVSPTQEKQFVSLGENIKAIEIEGKFDDCQRLVKEAFLNKELTDKMILTSANSINLARLIPQSFYYFYGYSQMKPGKAIVCSVPSGNFGNLCAGVMAQKMGLPIKKFMAATNINDIVPQYLTTGMFNPRPSIATLSNAMDVGNPSNFTRILDLFDHSHDAIHELIEGFRYTDEQTKKVIREVYDRYHYLLEPHGAIGYCALKDYLDKNKDYEGFFCETAHPAKFIETMEEIINAKIPVPERLENLMSGVKQTVTMKNNIVDLQQYLLSRN